MSKSNISKNNVNKKTNMNKTDKKAAKAFRDNRKKSRGRQWASV